ncbi:MAG TPA: hypothetical protein PKL56_16705 [Cyclobacteriaceae bacterium]|nr:hypothetical protein [Cyclobacteriaceae bacterium]HMV09267.1 hypothetical protein [Cyclobacteriaceae bacterium]HMV91256.1 hypothetical protein [Cyclobacteriaceae bacterium]HMX01933.1 hypothetical protein [Cyclobacteriaceae bacterium]HMX50856.1 hypothetical protein [Cyclobacteriaceae bacterium]
MILVKYIETSLWNQAIEKLLGTGWEMTHQYDGMDAGIDYNSYTLEKGGEKITFEWTNWDEGEIRCTEAALREIEALINHRFRNVESGSDSRPGTPPNKK